MTLSRSDSFVELYLSRHASTRYPPVVLPMWLSWVLCTVIAVSSVVCLRLEQPSVLIPTWCIALAFTGAGVLAWPAMAVSAVLTCAGYVFFGLLDPDQQGPSIELTAVATLTGVSALLIGRTIRMQERLGRERAQNGFLRQLCQVWGQSEGHCLKEIDLAGRLQAMNEQGMRVMEVCDFDLLRGADWLAFWQGDWEEPAKRSFGNALAGQFSKFSGFCQTASGTPKWWDVLLLPVKDEQGNVESILSLSWDVTSLRASTEALRTANLDYKELMDTLEDGFYRLDRSWCFVQANSRAELLLGQGESLIGKSLYELCPETARSELGGALRDAMEQGFARHLEWYCQRFDDWYRISIYPRSDGVSVFIKNITTSVAAIGHLQTAKARLELTQRIGRFAAWSFDLGKQQLELSEQAISLLALNITEEMASQQAVLLANLHPDDRLAFVTALLDVTEGAKSLDIKLRMSQAAGENPRYFHFAGALVSPHGQTNAVLVGSVQDVTDQQARERELTETEAFTRGVIDALPQSIAVLDERGRVITGNRAWEQATPAAAIAPFGLEQGADYLEFCRTLVTKGSEAAQELIDGIEALLEGIGGPLRVEYRLNAHGQLRSFQGFATLLAGDVPHVVLVHEDITEAAQLRAALADQTQRLNLVQEGSNDGIWEWRPADNSLYVSDRFVELTGYSLNGYVNFAEWVLAHVHPEDVDVLSGNWSAHLEQKCALDVEMRLRTTRGWRWFRIRGKAQWTGSELLCVAGALMDINLQHQLLERVQASETRFREMVEHLPHVFWEYDVASSRLSYLSPAFEKLLGMSPDKVYEDQDAWLRLVHPEDRTLAERFQYQALFEHHAAEVEFRVQTPTGVEIWVRDRSFPFTDGSGKVVRMIGIAEDITEARTFERKFLETACFDRVTGLPNRDMFNQRVQQQCLATSADSTPFLVLSIVVKRVKRVQRVLGQPVKDELMKRLAECFDKALAGRGYLACLGSDQYGVLLSRWDELAKVDEITKALLHCIQHPFELTGDSLTVNAYIGIARFLDHGDDAEALLKNAQATAYSVAQSGLKNYDYFNPALLEQDLDTLRLETGLEKALERSEFVLYYQPKVSLQDNRVCGAEALIRWNHPLLGLISPLRFVPLLEESGMIVPVGLWCIGQALSQLTQWHAQGLKDFIIAVNVSVRQLRPELVDYIRQAIVIRSVTPACLELELTESITHADDAAVRVVSQLKALGVRIAVDDFGTGYATLGSLRSFVPDVVKIDKSFLEVLINTPADQAIVRSIIDMGHALGMTVVAEGVETEEQRAILQQLGCDEIQGYLIAPPVEALRFTERFVTHS